MKNVLQFLGLTQETIGRGRYFVANITASLGLPIAVSLLMSFFFSLFEDDPVILYPLLALFIASLVFSFVVYIKTSIRRVRDIGIARSWWVLAIIPLVNIPFFIFLCLKKGESGSGHSSLQKNPFTEQFKRFFSHELSKPFMIICFGLIVAGIVFATYKTISIKSTVGTQIAQQEYEIEETFYTQYGDAPTEAERKFNECRDEYINQNPSAVTNQNHVWQDCGLERVYLDDYITKYEESFLNDERYNELKRIEQTPHLQLFFDNFSFGWWGVIALVSVFFINIIILFYKLIRMYVPPVFRYGNAQTKSIKTNMHGMAPFQRYSLTLLVITVLALTIIAIAIIF